MRLLVFVLTTLFVGSKADGGFWSAISYATQKIITDQLFNNCSIYDDNITSPKDVISTIDLVNVTLNIYTIKGSKSYSLLTADKMILQDKSLPKKFNIKLPVVIYIPGYIEDTTSEGTVMNTQAFLKKGGLNVLALDSSAITGISYKKSVRSVEAIGNALGKVVVAFCKAGVLAANIRIVGFSLGAHIAGFVGRYFKKALNKPISRITGLDPAGPCFKEYENLQLVKTDAEFVEVIHTDAGTLGLSRSIGHADFYPNEGNAQPCAATFTLNHLRAYALYAESINNEKAFIGVKCNNWDAFRDKNCTSNEAAYMGYGLSTSASGVYYLATKGSSPYGLYELSVQPQSFSFWAPFSCFFS